MKCPRARQMTLVIAIFMAPVFLADRSTDKSAVNVGNSADDWSDMFGGESNAPKDNLRLFVNSKRMNIDDKSDPVVLSVYFMLSTPFTEIELRLPPGYTIVTEGFGCGVYNRGTSADSDNERADAQEVARQVKAQHLKPHIQHSGCHVYERKKNPLKPDELPRFAVRLEMKPDVAGISKVYDPPDDRTENGENYKWWCFALQIRNPSFTPEGEDNRFRLLYFPVHRLGEWEGSVDYMGWDIMGDWDCKYSEWEGWGQCSSMCGGGNMRLTRRLVGLPPSHAHFRKDLGAVAGTPRVCDDPLEIMVPCNQFPCSFRCELVDVPEDAMGTEIPCSVECGGGVRPRRSRWRGDNCPQQEDYATFRYETCNPQPCKARCILSDSWTVVTQCSEVCGEGTYRMMREVIQKDSEDAACVPEWREVKCVRQWCSQLAIIRPDRNILPFPGDTYYIVASFKLTFPIRSLVLNAPGGYRFGDPGSDCFLHDHDMMPALPNPMPPNGCKVGTQTVSGAWESPRSLTITFSGLLRPGVVGRYSFMTTVVNPDCPKNERWRPAVTLGPHYDEYDDPTQPLSKEICLIPFEQNLWSMELKKEMVSEGDQPKMTIYANGYELHNPEESRKDSMKGDKAVRWQTAEATDVVAEEVESPEFGSSWTGRNIYCSPRLEPCPNNEVCPSSGICPNNERFQVLKQPPIQGIDKRDYNQMEDDYNNDVTMLEDAAGKEATDATNYLMEEGPFAGEDEAGNDQ